VALAKWHSLDCGSRNDAITWKKIIGNTKVGLPGVRYLTGQSGILAVCPV